MADARSVGRPGRTTAGPQREQVRDAAAALHQVADHQVAERRAEFEAVTGEPGGDRDRTDPVDHEWWSGVVV